jgi:hypothetical protein
MAISATHAAARTKWFNKPGRSQPGGWMSRSLNTVDLD